MDLENTLKGKTQREKVSLKADEIVKVERSQKEKVDDYDVEIIDITKIEGGIEVLARVWDENGQIGFGKDGTVDIERFRIINPPVLVDDAAGIIERQYTNEFTKEVITRKLREDPKGAILQSIKDTVRVKKEKFDSKGIVPNKIGNTTTTVYPSAGAVSPCDGRCYMNDQTTWAAARDAATSTGADATTASDVFARCDSQSGGGSKFSITRTIFSFTTSAVGSDTISSAVFSFYGNTDTDLDTDSDSFRVVSAAPAATDNVVTGDYDSLGTTGYASDFDATSWSTSGYNDITFNATGRAAINGSGITTFGVRTAHDADNQQPNGRTYKTGYFADQTGTSNDPKLVIEHAAASTFTPRLIIVG